VEPHGFSRGSPTPTEAQTIAAALEAAAQQSDAADSIEDRTDE
jgi:hypothetical protein